MNYNKSLDTPIKIDSNSHKVTLAQLLSLNFPYHDINVINKGHVTAVLSLLLFIMFLGLSELNSID